MHEPFKELFNPAMIAEMASHLARAAPGFDAAGFAREAADGLAALELKARASRIASALEAHLPSGWDGVEAMLAALHPEEDAPIGALTMDAQGVRGWALMPMADVVAARALALGRFDEGMAALAAMTRRFSSEFAVRPLIAADPARALDHLHAWAGDGNLHVRRLASEGSRPRLPWGLRLRTFVEDPRPLAPLLGRLRDDPEEYVRRSVANNLNDIAKDHPALIVDLARDWLLDAPPARIRLVRHALRSLAKAGDPGALAALGFGRARVTPRLELVTPTVPIGGELVFAVELAGTGRVALDYAIHMAKANGRTRPKVFKWRELELHGVAPLRLARRHSFRPVTVRRYYAGVHRVVALANGAEVAAADFELVDGPAHPAG